MILNVLDNTPSTGKTVEDRRNVAAKIIKTMAVRYFLASDIINSNNNNEGTFKPSGTLGSHQIQFAKVEDNFIMIRGIGKKTFVEKTLEDRAYSIEELSSLPFYNGKFGEFEFEEISPWMEVGMNSVIRYDCGEITICKGQFAALKRSELLGEPGARVRIQKFLLKQWISKRSRELSLSKNLIKLLLEDSGLPYYKIKIEKISSPLKEFCNLHDDEEYNGYRVMLKYPGSQRYEYKIHDTDHRVWKETYWSIPDNDRAGGYRPTSAIYYIL